MSTAVANIDRAPSERLERNVPVYGFPVINGFFFVLAVLVLVR